MAISRVQSKTHQHTTGNSISITLDSTPTNGNVLILTFAAASTNNNPQIGSVVQTGVTWTRQIQAFSNNAADGEIWLGVVSSGASTSITVNLSGQSGSWRAIANVAEYSGIATNPLDKTATYIEDYPGSGTNMVTGTTTTTTQANELWVGCLATAATTGSGYNLSSPQNGFTLLDGLGEQFSSYAIANGFLEKIVSATGAASSGATASVQSWQANCIATFKASTGATLQTVTDSLALSDSTLRNKGLLPVTDAVGLGDAALSNKTLVMLDSVDTLDSVKGNKSRLIVSDMVGFADLVNVITGAILKTVADAVSLADAVRTLKTLISSDSLALVDAVSTPSRVLRALDAAGLADGTFINKVLAVTENVSLVEVVEVGVEGAKKTKLFLVLGDLALQLTGDQ
jgi:hypothetical protein